MESIEGKYESAKLHFQYGAMMYEAFIKARLSAFSAMERFPQPNYTAAKIGEEAGEVVRAYIHMAEGRASREEFEAECAQLIGLVLRLMVEDDQTILMNLPKGFPK